MMADGRFGHVKMCGDLPGGKVFLCQQLQNTPPGRISQGFECVAQNGTPFLVSLHFPLYLLRANRVGMPQQTAAMENLEI